MTERVLLLDDHAHPFPLEPAPLDLAELTLDVAPDGAERRRQAAPSRLMLESLRTDLAALLGCAPDEVEQGREQAATDWPAYVRRLFGDAGIGGMLLDGGMTLLGPADLERYSALAAVPTWSLLRLEAV